MAPLTFANTSRRMAQKIHIINPFTDLAGSPMRALMLYEQLAPHADVTLWSEYQVEGSLAPRYPIRTISLPRLRFPKTGTFVVVGVYFRVGRWYYLSRPQRVILVNNIPRSHSFDQRMRKLTLRGRRRVEVVFASKQLRAQFGLPGPIEYSLIDLERFRPPAAPRERQPFTVGRLSRDAPEKHHPTDPALYRRLTGQGCRIRILGGNSLSTTLQGEPAIELLPFAAQDPAAFLPTLDAFFYRTAESWLEPFGRVVAEAMACGLPVVCHRRGGYAEIIDHGHDGFLFDDEEEAVRILMALKENPHWRHEVGKAARRKVESIYSPQQLQSLRDFYLSSARIQEKP